MDKITNLKDFKISIYNFKNHIIKYEENKTHKKNVNQNSKEMLDIEMFAIQISDLEKESFEDAWSMAIIKENLKNEKYIYVIARENDKIIGFVTVLLIAPEAEILRIAVSIKSRRCKIAKMLMEKLLEELKLHKISEIILEVRKSNEPAIELYKKYDFKETGIRKDYYKEPLEDAIIMVKNM
jgi:ribosomal-protein-alanine acetyltransferase